MLTAGYLLTNHVLMALESNGRNIFLTRSCFFCDYDITGRICLAGKIMLCGKFLEKLNHFLLMTRFTRNTGDFAENVKY